MAGGITFLSSTNAAIPTPPAGKVTVYFSTDLNQPAYKDSTGTVTSLIGVTGPQGPMGPVPFIPETFTFDDPIPFSQALLTPASGQTITATRTDPGGAFADITNLTVNITPSSVRSKIHVVATITTYFGAALSSVNYRILRGASSIQEWDDFFNNNTAAIGQTVVLDYIDSPASIAQQTYKVQGKLTSGFTSVNLSISGTPVSSISVEEILG